MAEQSSLAWTSASRCLFNSQLFSLAGGEGDRESKRRRRSEGGREQLISIKMKCMLCTLMKALNHSFFLPNSLSCLSTLAWLAANSY